MASSIVAYFKEHNGLDMPSFTLCPCGWDKSTISLHFPVLPFGITPNWLTCMNGTARGGKDPPHNLTPLQMKDSQ